VQHRVLGGEEDVMDVAVAVRAARPAAQDAGPPAAVALDRLDDLEQADLGRGTRQPVTAAAAGRGLDKSRPAEIAHHLGQEPDRDLHLLGDAAGARQLARGLAGEGEHRADGIVATAGQFESHRAQVWRPATGRAPFTVRP